MTNNVLPICDIFTYLISIYSTLFCHNFTARNVCTIFIANNSALLNLKFIKYLSFLSLIQTLLQFVIRVNYLKMKKTILFFFKFYLVNNERYYKGFRLYITFRPIVKLHNRLIANKKYIIVTSSIKKCDVASL